MIVGVVFFFFFQAEDGIRDYKVTGVDVCSSDLEGQFGCAVVLDPAKIADVSDADGNHLVVAKPPQAYWVGTGWEDRKSVVEGKRVDLGGRRIIKKKKGKRSV